MTLKRTLSILSLIVGALLAIPLSAAAAEPSPTPLFTDSEVATVLEPGAARSGTVGVNLDVLVAADGSARLDAPFAVELPDGTIVTVLPESQRLRGNGDFTVSGSIAGYDGGWATLVVRDGVVTGSVSLGAKYFEINYAGLGIYDVVERSASEIAPLDAPLSQADLMAVPAAAAEAGGAAPEGDETESGGPSGGPVVEILVVYTTAAKNGAGGTAQIQGTIQLALDQMNDALDNSAVTMDVALAAAVEVSYTESGNASTDLARLRSTNDGHMDVVHSLRDTYEADLVSLYTESLNYGGLAYVLQDPLVANADTIGFSVVRRNQAAAFDAFAHEIGHNLGAAHNRANASAPGAYDYSYGYQVPGSFRTVMSYACSVFCWPQPHYSNPDVLFSGMPTGIPLTAPEPTHNALTFENTSPAVAAWRGAAPTHEPVVSLGPDVTIGFGDVLDTSGSFSDADSVFPFTATVDYGAGAGPVPLTLFGFSFTLNHTYAIGGTFTVTVCVTDSTPLTGCDTKAVTVTSNQAPVVDVGPNRSIAWMEAFSVTGTYVDSDGDGPYVATVDYGEGSGPVSVGVSGSTFSLSHVFGSAGSHIVTACVLDLYGAQGCDSVTVTVAANIAPTVSVGADAAVGWGDTFSRVGSFSDADGGGPYSATVDYGAGAVPVAVSGTTFSLSHIFGSTGAHTVTACVTDAFGAEGCDSLIVTVASNSAPVVSVGGNVSLGWMDPLSRSGSFTDSDGDGPYTATVDYGEGSGPVAVGLSGLSFSLSHTFGSAGTHTVTVCVTDGFGAEGCDSFVVSVASNSAPVVSVGGSVSLGWMDPLSRSGSFTDSDGDGPYTATVDYGEGSGPVAVGLSGSSFSLSHTFGSAGTHTVTVCVTDGFGAEGCDSFVVSVASNSAPVVSVGGDVSLGWMDPLSRSGSFTDSDGDGPYTATVDYGEGSGPEALTVSGTNFTLNHVFSTAGSHVVSVCVADAFGDASCDSLVATVAENLAPSVFAGSDAALGWGDSLSRVGSYFDSDGDGPYTATVDYGEGAGPESIGVSGSTFSLSHVFGSAGAHTVTVCVADAFGAQGCDALVVTVAANEAPVVNGGADVSLGWMDELSVTGSFTDSDGDGPYTATVDYGEGAGPESIGVSGSTFSLSHVFGSAGAHTVTVCVADAFGAQGCDALVVTVAANEAPVVNGGADVSLGWMDELSVTGSFTDSDGDGPYTATVDYGEGAGPESIGVSGSTFSLSHVFGSAGAHTVTVCVADAFGAQGCDALVVTVAANEAPTVDAGNDFGIRENNEATVTGTFVDTDSVGPWTGTIDWGSGQMAVSVDGSGFTASHLYPIAGDYLVTACVTDEYGATGCDSITVSVVDNLPPAVNAGANVSISWAGPLFRVGTFADDDMAGPFSATVDYGAGAGTKPLGLSSASFTLFNIYNNAGAFTVTVCITDGDGETGCDSFVATQLANAVPDVDAGPDVTLDWAEPLAVSGSFVDPDGTSPFTATVDYGSGPAPLPLEGPAFTLDHVFGVDGVFTVTVCVSDASNATGCDAITVTALANDVPTVDIGANRSLGFGEPLEVIGSFTDTNGSGPWTGTIDFGDGSVPLALDGAAFAAQHVFDSAGSRVVSACITDEFGATGCDSIVATVASNQTPSFDLGPNQTLTWNEALIVSATVADDLTSGPWTTTVDYGQGLEPLALEGMQIAIDHVFEIDGVSTVTVCVADTWSATGCDSLSVDVAANQAPTFDAGPDHVIDTGTSLIVDIAWSDPDSNGPWMIEVLPGDGSPSQSFAAAVTAANFEVSFAEPGMFPLTACVTDEDGANACDTLFVTATVPPVVNQPPTPGVDIPVTGLVGVPWQGGGSITDADSAGPFTVLVDYGDGAGLVLVPNAGNQFSLSTTYFDAATYEVVVCVFDDAGGQGCDAGSIVIQNPLNEAPVVHAVDTVAATAGSGFAVTVEFGDDSAGPWTVDVDFGDGAETFLTDDQVVLVDHAYAGAGYYDLRVCITDAQGATGCTVTVVTVNEAPSDEPPGDEPPGDEPPGDEPPVTDAPIESVTYFDTAEGLWIQSDPDTGEENKFYVGNPGDYPLLGDWNCNGEQTPGLYRQSDGFVYLRFENSQGTADVEFYFGDPGDVPLAGDFNGNGCDTVAIYRPSTGQFFIINQLGEDQGGLGKAEVSYYFGNPGDKPFVGDFDGDGIDEVGLHREDTGFVYFRNDHTQGPADKEFFFGDPGDLIIAGDWDGDGVHTVGLFRPSDACLYLRNTNSQGTADITIEIGADGVMPLAGAMRRNR